MRISQVVFDEKIYPRLAHDPTRVQQYADVLEVIEAAKHFISVAADYRLIDGRHRHLAYRTRYEKEPEHQIPVLVWPVTDDGDIFDLACDFNSDGNIQLTTADKKRSAIWMYTQFQRTQEHIAKCLRIRLADVNEWLSRILKEQKDRENEQILDLWFACYTTPEIAARVGLKAHQNVSARLEELQESFWRKNFAKVSFQDDFDPPLYNIWKQQDKSNKVHHFGNTEAQWVHNLLYLYTAPFNIVVDPFGGGGSTIDTCRYRGRRFWVSDRKPTIAREDEIRKWDVVTDGLPPLHKRWHDVKLVYLDPPYWKQAEGEYSDDVTDLANMDLLTFTDTLSGMIRNVAKKLHPGAKIALVMQPTQWKAPDKQYTDHVADMLRAVKLPLHMRFSVPYESQQCTAQMVDWAKSNKQCLVLSREIVVWEVEG